MAEIKTYIINDNWTDLGAENKVAVLSVDGEIDKVYVNGEEAGGGGGDFSTAEVTFADYSLENSDYEQAELPLVIPCPCIDDNVIKESFTINNFTDKMTVPLYKGHTAFNQSIMESGIPAVSGNIVRTVEGEIPRQYININIAGDGVLKLGFEL